MWRCMFSALCLVVSISGPSQAQDWAAKMFKVTTHDFGTVASSAKAEYEFVLTNLYMEDVHVAAVRSSCGCTDVRIKDPDLKTYQQGAIVATINTRAFQGQRGATITVTLDKPYYAEIQLHDSVYIRSDVVFNPGSVEFGAVDEGQPAVHAVAVGYAGRSDWRILEVRSSNPHLSGEVKERRRDASGRVEYVLTARLDGKTLPGSLHDHLMLVTNDYNMTQVPLAVGATVESAISVNPGSLYLGQIKAGETITKHLVVRGKKPFRILSVRCPDPGFKFDISGETAAKTVHVIPVSYAAGQSPGKVAQTIRIETDLGETPPELSAFAVVGK